MTGPHSHHSGHQHGPGECDTTDRHGMLLFGEDPPYLSHLPMYACPHNFQVLTEAELDAGALDVLRADRARHGDGMYTFDPVPFPIAELEPQDGVPALTSLKGTLVRGHFERGGTPVATGVRVDVRRVVWFSRLDTESKPVPGRELGYLCFGRGDRLYLAHELRERPGFDQVLTVRLVPGTVRTPVGHPLDDDVSEIRFEQAQPVSFGRDDGVEHRLSVGEVATASFPATRSPSLSRGFTVGVEVERQLYLEVDELA
ncbi:hypothetical protein [Streptomyces sp. HUAS ZL42]|uniref:hypothetical protein n=1 Tax=Streptomyces sp. HUAS ZL42 TaxID=3231715 RepID=UPI00345E0A60